MSDARNDLELFERWRMGDNRCGNTLMKRHLKALKRYFVVRALGFHDDLVQRTCVACVAAMDAFRGEASFRAYLFGLARFQLYSHYRWLRRRSLLDFSGDSICELAVSSEDSLSRFEDHQQLQLALPRISSDQRAVLDLTYWKDLPAPDVARALGIPENTVYSRLRRGREQLRQELACAQGTP
jgi:RNA polymerase sigma factor (sigma-70 family)